MANILSLAVRVTGDASGLQLNPVEKALQRLQQESDKTSAIFEKFAQTSELGAKAQQQFDAASEALLQTLRDGNITRDEFVKQFEELEAGARETAAALAEGARVTEANRTAEERYAVELQRLNGLREKGGIDQETYNRAVAAARKPLDDAAAAAERAAQASGNSALKFNELSGVFAVLPGPLGNIAGRISGITSASEGLTRIFSGGLQSGLSNVVGSFTALATPVNLALAGVTAFAAGASALASSLVALEDRVEKLGRLSDQLGVSLEFAQVLEEAGARSDVSVQQISSSFARLQDTLAGGGEESKKASEALGNLGISLEEFGLLSEQQQIELIGERLGAIEDPAKKSAAALDLFGKSGVQLLPFFRELRLTPADIERFGRAVTDVDKARLEELGAGLDALRLASKGLGDSLTLPFVGLGEGVARAGAEIIAGFRSIVDPIGRILEPLFTQIGRIVEQLGNSLGSLGRIIGAVFEPFAEIVQSVSRALEPLYEGLFDFLASINDAAVATTEWLISFTTLGTVAANAQILGDTISRIVTIITTAATRIAEFFGEIARSFAETVQQSEVLSTIANVVSAVFETISSFVGGVVKGIGDFVNNLLTLAENFLGIDRSAAAAAESVAEVSTQVVGLTDELAKAQQKTAEFGNAGVEVFLEYSQQLEDIAALVAEGEYTQEQANRAIALATAEYEKQVVVLSDQAKAQEELAKAEQERQKEAQAAVDAQVARIDELLGKEQELTSLQKDTLAVEEEIARVEEAAAKARAANNTEQAEEFAARLGQLDQLQAKLEQQADEAAQGFDKGFAAAFDSVGQGIQKLTADAAQFGNEGFEAAQRLSDGIAAAQAQVEDGIFNREAFEREVARQEELYRQRIDQLEDERAAREKAENAIASERQKINEFVDKQLAASQGQADNARIQAAKNVQAIEQEIGRVQAEISKAREAGDKDAIQAGEDRIRLLEQVASQEEDIASGRAEREQQIASQRDAALKAQQQQQAAFAEKQEEYYRQAIQRQQQQIQQFQDVLQRNAQENARILASYRELATASTQPAQGADIRTDEGARNFIQALQGGFDPQLAVQRQQLKVQQRIATGIESNLRALGFQTFSFPAAAGA